MAETERISIKLYVGDYERKPEAELFELSDADFEISYEKHTYPIEDVGPADVFLTSTQLIVAGAGVISAAVTGAFTYLATRNGGKIIISGEGGRTVEVPEGTSKEDIEFYISKAKEIDAHSVLVSGSQQRREGKKDRQT
ncbi:hypothetical protein [Methylophaga sp.]|uniref:hypothetical protein n=1 Tax=Methylophaga sp. TaxID=2024840 RepID=UPI0025F46D53|nr:hypothetical protein [Methylophaga sp.]